MEFKAADSENGKPYGMHIDGFFRRLYKQQFCPAVPDEPLFPEAEGSLIR